MGASKRVSEAVIKRLPRYYRHLSILEGQGIERISSEKLALQMRLNASQVRQDFNCFGGFGQQGYGYNISSLLAEIRAILAIDRPHSLVIAGAGNIGRALTCFAGFEEMGFRIEALFDVDPAAVGTEVNGKPVLDMAEMEEYIRAHNIEIGVVAARRKAVQGIADGMVRAGVRGIWNFVPVDLVADVPTENVHLSDSICALSYKIAHEED
ncbi:MAG TPA: redox-sensing transcriptional repressor Rex [Clostridia bacterium]|nr:MAG: Redox-sensing transcriptional repressor Rex [Firmicutes bacterium ADurb.Bin248]HOG01405.1 redox-sensing transcriptional repressor Rex [Clostridia bacterium]HOS18175.1 redox-sensing transcriptional repressor Rex [Clostridia bacterium]HPK16768.1 redox-sensing transcriptional repressor Rex [Clostridia bacterium]